jgi:hypothetical protein
MDSAIKQLKKTALEYSRKMRPGFPEAARSVKTYSDKTANGLTRCIIDFCRFNGHLAERTGCTGRYIDNSRVVCDTLGFKKRIGTGKWIPTSGTKGTSDLHLLIKGISIACEIKMKDKMRPDQIKYKEAFEAAGGRFWVCHSFSEFLNYYNELC